MQTKKELRTFAKQKRKELNIEEISKKIIENFINWEEYKKAENIALYYPFGDELNIKPLLEMDKTWFLPKIEGENMVFCLYEGEDSLKLNKYGIKEPQTEEINSENIDMIILPALMADKNGYRLGYGKSFYDKYIKENKLQATKVIFIAEELFVDNLPKDEWDEKADFVITEKVIARQSK